MSRIIDHTGDVFGKLTVIRQSKKQGATTLWCCVCSCGTRTLVNGSNLRRGLSKSCGSVKCADRGSANRTHGASRTRTYKSWLGMIQRCTNLSNPRYADYGGRGITVCKRWLKFENFLADMGERPPGLFLDRERNNEGYRKSNCRWVTRQVNSSNMRSNVHITHRGKTHTLSEWSRLCGVHINTLSYRIKAGWSVERALK